MGYRTVSRKQLEDDLDAKASNDINVSIELAKTMRRSEMKWAQYYKNKGMNDFEKRSVEMALKWHKKLHALLSEQMQEQKSMAIVYAVEQTTASQITAFEAGELHSALRAAEALDVPSKSGSKMIISKEFASRWTDNPEHYRSHYKGFDGTIEVKS